MRRSWLVNPSGILTLEENKLQFTKSRWRGYGDKDRRTNSSPQVEVHSSQWARPQPFWFKEVERYHVPRLQWVIGSRDSYLLLQCLHRCSRSWRMRAASLLGHHHVGCRHYTRCHPLGSRLCRSFWLQKRLWPYSCNAHFVSPVPTALLPVPTALFGKCLRGDFSFVVASMLLLMVDQWLVGRNTLNWEPPYA